MVQNKIDWRVECGNSLAPIATLWDDLAQRTGAGPCLNSATVSIAIEVLSEAPVVLVMGLKAGAPVIAAVLRRCGPGQWTTFQPSQLPLGAWLMDRSLDWEPTIRSLAQQLPGFVAICSVSQQDPRIVSRPTATSKLRDDDYINTAAIEVHGDFATYWEGRGKNLRQNSRKQRKKLTEQGVEPRLEIVREPALIPAAVAEFVRLESASWKQAEGSAVTQGSNQARFYIKLLTDRARDERGFVALLRLGENVAAADLCIHDGRQLVILKTAYDESLKGISPGQLMHEELFRSIFERAEFERVEFLGRVMEWHSRWTDDVRTLFNVTYYRSVLIRALRDKMARIRAATKSSALINTGTDRPDEAI